MPRLRRSAAAKAIIAALSVHSRLGDEEARCPRQTALCQGGAQAAVTSSPRR
ncbi:MAG: hypothetical protein R3F11_16685 [Verrucomicrobiales bacterium]